MPLPKVTSYVKNVGRSIAYASVDQLKGTNENISDFLETNEDVFKSVYASVTDMRRTIRRTKVAIKKSKIYEAADAGWKAVKEDLKTGNFYNKKRDEDFGMKAMGSDFNFSFDDDDFSFDDDFSSDGSPDEKFEAEDVRIQNQTNQLLTGFAAAVGKSAEAQAKVTSSSIAYLADVQRASAQMAYVQGQKLHEVTTEGFKGIHTGLTKMQDALNVHIENSRTFYQSTGDLMREQNAMFKEFLEMQRNLYNQEKFRAPYKESAIRNITTSGGLPDFAEWGKQIAKNAKNMGGGMADMLLGNAMGDDANMLLAMVGSPLKFIPNMIAKQLIPGAVRKGLRKTDKIAGGVFSNLMGRMANSRRDYDDSLFGMISRLFGVDIDSKNTIDPSKYHKGPLPFDGYTRQSIIEVIPTYLRRIESALTGGEERLYDYNTGRWKTYKVMKKELDRQMENDVASAMYDLQDTIQDMLKQLKDNGKAGTASDIKKQVNEMMKRIYQDNGVFQPYKRAGDYDEDAYMKYGFTNEEQFHAVVDYLMTHNPQGLAGMAKSVQSQKESRASAMRDAELGVSVWRAAFNDSMMGDVGKRGIAGTNFLAAMTDKYNHTVFDYLRTIVGQLAVMGTGGYGKGKKKKGPQPPTPQNPNSIIAQLMGETGPAPSNNNQGSNDVDEDSESDIMDTMREIQRQREQEARLNGNDKDLTKRQLEKLGIDTSTPIAEQMLRAGSLGDKIAVMRANIDKLLNKPADFVTLQLNKVDQHLMRLMFGKKVTDAEGKEYDSILDMISGKISDTFDKAAEEIDKKMDWIKEKMQPWIDKAKKKLHWEDFKKSLKRQASGLWSGFKGSMSRTYGQGYKYLRRRLEEGKVISPEDMQYYDEMNSYWGDLDAQSQSDLDDRVDWSQFMDEMGGPLSRDDYDDIVYGSARGRRIRKTGLTMVSPGEIIIPATFNRRKQNRQKNKEMSVFRRMFKGGPTPRTNAAGNDKMLQMFANNPEMLAKWQAIYAAMGHSDYNVAANMGMDANHYDLLATGKRLSHYMGEDAPVLEINGRVYRAQSDYERDYAREQKMYGPAQRRYSTKSREQDFDPGQTNKQLEQWVNFSAGKNADKGTIRKILKENKGFGVDAVAGGVLGGGIGLLLGGPLLGAAIGAGINLTKHSETMQKFLFGEVGEDGTRQGGLVGKKVIDGFDKYFGDMKDFGLAGGVAGLFTPFGPVGGIMIGSAIGYAKNNEKFQNWLFGEKDEKGERMGGVMSKDIQDLIHKAVPNMTKGAIAGVLLGPFSILPNMALGAGVGMLATSQEFQEMILGVKNEEGKREGGLVGAFKDGFIKPAREKLADLLDEAKDFTIKHVLNPLKDFAKPMTNALINMASDIAHGVKDAAVDMLEKSIGGPLQHFMQTRFFKGALNLLGKGARIPIGLGKLAIGAPAHALGFIGNSMRMSQIRRGTDRGSTAAEREAFMNKHFIRSGKLPFYSHEARVNDKRMGSMTQEELDDFIARGSNLLAGDRGLAKQRVGIADDVGRKILDYFDQNGLTDTYGKYVKKIAKAVKTGDETEVTTAIRAAMIPPQHQRPLLALLQDGIQQNAKLNGIRAEGRGTLKDLSKKSGFKLKNRRQLRHMLEYAKSEKKDIRFAPDEVASKLESDDPQVRNEGRLETLQQTVEYGFNYLASILRNQDPMLEPDPKDPTKLRKKAKADTKQEATVNYDPVGGGNVKTDPETGNPLDDKETTTTLKERRRRLALEEEQTEATKENAKGLRGLWEGLFGKKEKKENKGSGMLSKLLGLVGRGLGTFFGWGGSVLARFGIPVIGAGLGISALGWGSQWWKTTAWPSLKNFFLGKQDESGNREGGFLDTLYNSVGEPIKKGIDTVATNIGKLVGWFHDGGLQRLFTEKIVPNIITGWGYFAENILGPLVGTVIASLPKLGVGIIKGIGQGLRALLPGSNKSLKSQKPESDLNEMTKDAQNLMKSNGSITDNIAPEYKESLNAIGRVQSSFAKGYNAGKTYGSQDLDIGLESTTTSGNDEKTLLGSKRTNQIVYDQYGNDVTDYKQWNHSTSIQGGIIKGSARNFVNALSGATSGTNLVTRFMSGLKVRPLRALVGGPIGMVTQSVKGVGKLAGKSVEASGRAGSALRNFILGGTDDAARAATNAGGKALANGADMVDNLMGGAGKSNALSNLDDAIGKAISQNSDDVLSKAGSIIANTSDDIAEAGANAAAGGGVFTKIGKALNAAKNKGQELLSKITGSSAAKAATDTAANAAKSSGGLLNTIKNGISKAFSWLAESKVGQVILGAAKKVTSNKFVQAIIAPGGIAKVLNKLASAISNLGEGAIAKGSAGALNKIAGACGSMSPLTFIFMVTDFLDGWRNTETSLGVSKNDYTAPWYLKMAAGLAQIINGRFFLGLVSKSWIMDKILGVFKTFGLDISDVEAARDHAEDALKELNAELIANGEDPVDNMQDANKKIAEQNSIWGKFKKAGTDVLNKFRGTNNNNTTTNRSSRSTRFGGRGRAYMKESKYQNKRFGMSTLGQAGCGPIAAANMMDYLSGGDRVGAAAAMAQHYIDPRTGGTTIDYFNDYFRANGVPSTQTDSRAALMANLQRGGKAVILGHGKSTATTDPFGNGDHYINVLGTRNRGQDMIIDDPDMPTGRRRLPTKRVLSGMKSSVLVGRGRGDRFERLEPLSGRGFSDGARGGGFGKIDASNGPALMDQIDAMQANLDPAGLTAKSTAKLNKALGVKYDFATGTMSANNLPTSTLSTSNLGPDAIINIAISQIGYGPSYKHSKYDQACVGRDRSAHWCGSFVWWCFNQAGAEHLIPCQRHLCPSCDYMYKGFAQAGQEVKTPQKGDILFFSWDGGTNCDHVGIVTGVAENGYVLTIEGNTSDDTKGATYGCVQRKKRNPKNIIHYVRPKYPYTYDASKVVNMSNYGDKNDYKRIALMGGQMDPNLLTYSQSSTFNGMNGTTGENTESTGGKLISALKNLGVSVLKAMYGRDAYETLFGEAQTDDTAVYGDDSSYNAHALATGTYSSDIAGNTTAQKIWNRLGELGYTKEGRAGIMGNLRAESGLIPNNLQNTANKRLGVTDEQYTTQVDQGTRSLDSFMHDSGGYGLAQWTYKTRKQGLYNATRQNGRSISDLAGQLGFLDQELSAYPKGLQEFLKSTNDINKASDRFLDEFERPAKHHYDQRRGFSQDIYASLKDYTPATNATTSSQVVRDPQTGAIISTGGMTGSELRDVGLIDNLSGPVNNTMGAVDDTLSDPTTPTGSQSSNRRVHRTRTGYSASGRGRNGLKLRGSQIKQSASFSGMARMPNTTYTPYQGAATADNRDLYDMIASIVQILMQVANNTALLDQVVNLLSKHLGVDVKASDVQQAVQTGNLDQAQRNLDRLISRSSGNNSNVSSLLQSKDSAYLVDAMTALARE